MRAMFTVTASLLICAGLLGCDRSQPVQASGPVPVAAVPACNCPQQAAAAPVTTPRKRRHHHRAWHEHESGPYSESYSSESESSPGSSSGDAGESDIAAESGQSSDEAQAEGAVWIDGYGQSHYETSASASEDDNPGAVAAADVSHRLAPWHAYNANCDRVK